MARGNINSSTDGRLYVHSKLFKKNDEPQSSQLNEAIIERHWESFPWQAKKFLLDTLDKISLFNLLRFWSAPQLVEFTRGKVAGSICGASWYLALVYLKLGKIKESRALTLNGSFLQQCYNTSIDYIKGLCESGTSHIIEDKLPFFCSGFFSVTSSRSLESFLQEKLPAEYQRMMTSFVGFSSREPTMDYIGQISQDWNSSLKNQRTRRPKCENEENKIKITIVDEIGCDQDFCIGFSSSLKTLFNEYADKKGISLRNTRFSYKGKTIFLSSVGQPTPAELGMSDQDTITALSTVVDQEVEVTKGKISCQKPSRKGSPSNKKIKGKRKKNGHIAVKTSKTDQEYKIEHSQALTRLFEEAEPKFKQIRHDLNVLALECKKSRQMSVASIAKGSEPSSLTNPTFEDNNGKAGKSHFVVQVGEVENLYRTTKPSKVLQSNMSQLPCVASLDLHGLTKEEALKKLDQSLEEWKDEAMNGSYPWVIPVVIVCGCGKQVLSETVEQWIKRKRCVANAPKSVFQTFCRGRHGSFH